MTMELALTSLHSTPCSGIHPQGGGGSCALTGRASAGGNHPPGPCALFTVLAESPTMHSGRKVRYKGRK